jgi:hypothetical protein
VPPSVETLLRKADEAVARIQEQYEADLVAKKVSDDLLYDVRQVVQDCQSALDWTATAVKEKLYGASKWRPYFPLVKESAEFPAELEKQIARLRADHPDIASAFQRHQPYRKGKTELGYLHALARVNKHQDFAPQERVEQRRVEARFAGGSVSWDPSSVTFGSGVAIGGVPVNPATQRPVPHPSQTVTETIFVDWRFRELNVSVLPTLEALVRLTRAAVNDVRDKAGL